MNAPARRTDEQFFKVPPGTRQSQCGGATCRAPIYWIRTPQGRAVPVDCDVDGGQRPSDSGDPKQQDLFSGSAAVREGWGVSHSRRCPNADDFRGPR